MHKLSKKTKKTKKCPTTSYWKKKIADLKPHCHNDQAQTNTQHSKIPVPHGTTT